MHGTVSVILVRLFFASFLLFIQWYFHREVAVSMRRNAYPRWMRVAATCVFVMMTLPVTVQFFMPGLMAAVPDRVLTNLLVTIYVWQFSFLLFFIIHLFLMLSRSARQITLWAAGLFRKHRKTVPQPAPVPPPAFDPERRLILKQGLTIAASIVIVGNAYGAIRRNNFDTSRVTVPMKGLPPEFEGFTISLISDIHSGMFMPKAQMDEYVAAVNALGSDCIAVAGDFVNSTLEEVYPFAESFSALRAREGVYGVLGNHDYYTRQVDKLSDQVNQAGIRLLVNERVAIRRGGAQINILGSDDVGPPPIAGMFFSNLVKNTDPVIPRILLCHRPYFFRLAEQHSIGLTLSGHTHGGQIVFLRVGRDVLAPARLASRYVEGLYTIGNSHMYVSRGVGTVGIPIRLNCPPEITRLTLVAAR